MLEEMQDEYFVVYDQDEDTESKVVLTVEREAQAGVQSVAITFEAPGLEIPVPSENLPDVADMVGLSVDELEGVTAFPTVILTKDQAAELYNHLGTILCPVEHNILYPEDELPPF